MIAPLIHPYTALIYGWKLEIRVDQMKLKLELIRWSWMHGNQRRVWRTSSWILLEDTRWPLFYVSDNQWGLLSVTPSQHSFESCSLDAERSAGTVLPRGRRDVGDVTLFPLWVGSLDAIIWRSIGLSRPISYQRRTRKRQGVQRSCSSGSWGGVCWCCGSEEEEEEMLARANRLFVFSARLAT